MWTGVTTGLVFWVLDQYNMLRVEMEHEFKVSQLFIIESSDTSQFQGMDLLKHGESAYPADAWVEQQYMDTDENGSWPQSQK